MSLDFNPENRTTWLEAINAVLIKCGREPLTSAPSDGVALDPEADAVRNHLDRVTRELCAEGWHFNTVRRTLTPSSGIVTLDADMLEFNAEDSNIAVVNNQLRRKDTDVNNDFTSDVKGAAIIGHDLVDCPEAFIRYVIAKTAMELASSQFAETEFVPRLQLEEVRARGRWFAADQRTSNTGLQNNPDIWRRYGGRFRNRTW